MSRSPGDSSDIDEPRVTLASSIPLQQGAALRNLTPVLKAAISIFDTRWLQKISVRCKLHLPPPPPRPVPRHRFCRCDPLETGMENFPPSPRDVSLTFQPRLHSASHLVALDFVLVTPLISRSLFSVCFCVPWFSFQ